MKNNYGSVQTLSWYFYNLAGHDYIYHQCLQKAFKTLGLEIRTYIPIDSPPISNYEGWIKRLKKPKSKLLRRIVRIQELYRILKDSPKNNSCIIFIESFTKLDFFAIAFSFLF